MPAKKADQAKTSLPNIIKALKQFGVSMADVGTANWVGDCPFCGKERHFYCNPTREVWDCKRCGSSGNQHSLPLKIWEKAREHTSNKILRELSDHRKIPVEVLKLYGVRYWNDNDKWLVPVYSYKGALQDLRIYDAHHKFMASTAGHKSGLLGCELLCKAAPRTRAWLCEGEWDAMAMTTLLRELGYTKDVVVAVPGAGVFKQEWIQYFDSKNVVACYDHDQAGSDGLKKCISAIGATVTSLRYPEWSADLPKGYDIRDLVCIHGIPENGARATYASLMASLKVVRRKKTDDIDVEDATLDEDGNVEYEPITYDELISEFKSAIKLTPDLQDMLIVSLATCMSNDISGDPLWIYLIGPPGSGKTMILQAFSKSPRTIFRSSVTPHCLVSGWANSKSDPSLVPRLKGLTFVAKDFTEILSMPIAAQDEIYSTLRGAYDGTVQKTFGNGVTREYTDCRFSFLAGVTHAVHAHKNASLGERFLKFQLKDFSQKDATSIILAAMESVGTEADGENRLKLAVARFLSRKTDISSLPSFPTETYERITSLVQVIAILRANVDRDKYTNDMTYRPKPEMGTRLAKQLAKLGLMIAVVLDKKSVDAEVYRIVERVAYDTANGFHLDIVDAIMRSGGQCDRQYLMTHTGLSSATIQRRLEDLSVLRAIIVTKSEDRSGAGRPKMVYSVNSDLRTLWLKAKGEPSCPIRVKKKKKS